MKNAKNKKDKNKKDKNINELNYFKTDVISLISVEMILIVKMYQSEYYCCVYKSFDDNK